VVSPAPLLWTAHQLRAEARHLVPTLDVFLDAFGPTVWSGPAADRVRLELELERTCLVGVALELERIARDLEARAEAASESGPT